STVNIEWRWISDASDTGTGLFIDNIFVTGYFTGRPTSLTATDYPGDYGDKLNISWGASATPDVAYKLERATSTLGPFSTIVTTSSLSYVDTGLDKDRPYYYRIRATDGYNISPYTDITSGTPFDNYSPVVSINYPANGSYLQGTFNTTATIDDSGTGNSTVTAARFSIDTTASYTPATAIDGNFNSPTEGVQGTTDSANYADGAHTIYWQGKDDNENWSDWASVTVTFDNTGPQLEITGPSTDTIVSEDITATAKAYDTGSVQTTITASYYALDSTSTSYAMSPLDGNFDETTEEVYANINTTSYSDGDHTLYMRAKDKAGNYSTWESRSFKIDNSPPHSTSVLINSGDTYTTSTTISLTLSATDTISTVDEMKISTS
ncbi:MAG: fibronectin type III domain-containing protein, partial [Actinomycetia bacterium]|nr:fibronectin type III domain-containing protein [Actinomycetes bacterium]